MNWLLKLRNENKISQKELAEKTGLSIYTIQNIEQEKRKGSKKTIDILNNYFKKK